MFFKKTKRIKELEEKVLRLEQELEEANELALETHMKLQRKEWEEEREMKEMIVACRECECGATQIPAIRETDKTIVVCHECGCEV
ncbi:hypothetical protein [Bacillus pseudomycoides]|uniref:hypothetical protein n=1 Tax=Bacillus pseudomycoides TaxID=64104 RepID=UPI000BF0290C|nr:hypothetical protein [Bacillus pseudomycoides]PEK34099.1 hypothetical protein CN691_12840 [Bacillus pseudomycoides]